jgi:hypothetical protein
MPNIYTFVGDDGENIHINAIGLRKWCIDNKPEILWIPLDYEIAKSFVRDNVISLDRVKELMLRPNLDPIIMVKDGTFGSNGGPNALLVDGHHRFYLAYKQKKIVIEGYFLEVWQWKPFQLHGLPNMTKEQLRKKPITKRNY